MVALPAAGGSPSSHLQAERAGVIEIGRRTVGAQPSLLVEHTRDRRTVKL